MAKKRDKKSFENGQEETELREVDSIQNDTESEEGDEPIEDSASEQITELKDKYLRLFAEFENYKKRTLRERIDLIKTAGQDTIRAFLPVLDDFDRAKHSADQQDSKDQFSEGVNLVYHKTYKVMETLGVEAMDTSDGIFDEEKHDAITHLPTHDKKLKGKIIDVVEKGYTLNDKIIRHAKVVVGK